MATITKLPSGRWRVQVRRKNIYRAATFDRKRQAQDWVTKIEAQISSASTGYIRPPSSATLGELLDLFIDQTPAKGRTRASCLARLRERLGAVKLVNLSPVHLHDFLDRRVAEGAGGVTISQDLSYLASVLDWGRHVRQLDVSGNIARDARRALSHRGLKTRSTGRERLPTDAELRCLFDHWNSQQNRVIPMELITRFAIASAMRQSEITRILAEDVDEEARTVIIRDRKDPREKSGNDQAVPLVGEAWDIVAARLKQRPRGRLFPYRAESISAAFTRGCAARDIKDLHFHDLRHAGTVELFRKGLRIEQVALVTGHKSWENLRRYSNLNPADVHAALSDG